MDLTNYVETYFTSLDETQSRLDIHCRNIQLALSALRNRIEIEEELMQEVETDDVISVLSDIQLDEIDSLLRKAEKVLVEDVSKNGKKKSGTKPRTSKPDIAHREASSTQVKSLKVSKPNKKASSSTCKIKIQNPKSKRTSFPDKNVVLNENRNSEKTDTIKSRDPCTKEVNWGKQKPEKLPPLYDSVFKEEYCATHKARKELLKLQRDEQLIKKNRDSVHEFMLNVGKSELENSISDVLDEDAISQLPTSGLTGNEITEILGNIHDIRKNAAKIMGNNVEHGALLGENFVSIDTCSTLELKDAVKLMELRYNLVFQQNLTSLMVNDILRNNSSNRDQLLYYRQLYSLLCNSRSFPSLVENG